MRLLLGKDLAHAAAALGRTEPLGGGTRTPGERLSVQIIEIAETTRGEERFASETDSALHPTFLVPPRYRDRPRLEAVVGSQLEQRGMEADRLTHAFEHGALKIVIQNYERHGVIPGERFHMAADEVIHRGAQIEAQEQMPRIGKHHHEGHQRTHRAADGELAEMRPVDLRLFAG